MSKVIPNVDIQFQVPPYILSNLRSEESSHQDFVNKKLGRLVADSTGVGIILGNFLAAQTKEFTDQDSELQTDAVESIAACAIVACDAIEQTGADFFVEFMGQLESCSWTFNNKNPAELIDITSLDPKRVVNTKLVESLRLDYYLLLKQAIDGLEDDISLPIKDAISSLAVKDTKPVTVQFMAGVLDFDISVKKGKVIVEFVYFTYELEERLDLYGTKTCYTNVKAAHKHMSFDWEKYKTKSPNSRVWVKKLFYKNNDPLKPTDLRKAYIQEIRLHNNIVSLKNDVTNWVNDTDRIYEDKVNKENSIVVKKNADYENSAFNVVLFRCIQIFGSLKRHDDWNDDAGADTDGVDRNRKQTLDITVYLLVPLWGRVRLGTGSTVLVEAGSGNSDPWAQTFSILGVADCTLTFDLEKDPELWCDAKLSGRLTGPLSTKVHILNVDW